MRVIRAPAVGGLLLCCSVRNDGCWVPTQCVAIRRLVEDLNFGLEVVVCGTLREHDGLAMSSRNVPPLPSTAAWVMLEGRHFYYPQVYLSEEERKRATILYKALSAGRECYLAGERNAQEIKRFV